MDDKLSAFDFPELRPLRGANSSTTSHPDLTEQIMLSALNAKPVETKETDFKIFTGNIIISLCWVYV